MSNGHPKRGLTASAVLGLLVIALVGYAGNFHFVYGEGISLRKIEKVSWSISETVINADEVKATPLVALRVKYPLFIRASEKAAQ